MIQYDSKRVIVGGENTILIINIEKVIIEIKIEDNRLGKVNTFIILRDETILSGSQNGEIAIYDLKNKKLVFKKNKEKCSIEFLLSLNETEFIICCDKTIMLLKY